jgi:uncharacterized protein YjiS (DUF1127 family)/cyanate permease
MLCWNARLTRRRWLIWRLGLMFGATNATYFTTNAFIPDYLHHLSQSDLIGPALTALNIGQLPASLLLLVCAGRLTGRAWPYIACGALSFACVPGILFGDGWVLVAAAGALGFSCAASLTLMLTLPPLLSQPGDTHRMTAGMFTISYSCAVIVPVLSGVSWDVSGVPALAFIPIGLCNFLLIGLASTIPISGSKHTWSIARALPPCRPGLVGVVGGVRRLIFALDLALDVRRERRMLLSMDDRALKDTGFNRGEAYAEARRPLWDIPRDRLLL